MPIYEYACDECRTVFQFLTNKIGDARIPLCPKCGNPDLKKLISNFAISKRNSPKKEQTDSTEEGQMSDPFASMSTEQQAHTEREMMKLMSQAENMDENDPRQMGTLLRRLKETSGMDLGQEMDEAIRRLENGEDPEKVEEEMGPLLDDPCMTQASERGGWSYDNTLYDM